MPPETPPLRPHRRIHLVLLTLIVAWGGVARGGALVGPFGFGWQHLGAFYSEVARNYLRYGLLETRFAMVRNPEPEPPELREVYGHHPPRMGLTTAALAKCMDEGPLPVKLSGLLFFLFQIVITYFLVAGALSPKAGLAAAFATAVLPAGAYFASHGSELGPQALSLALLALLLDESARSRDPARPRSAAVLGAITASLFFAWPALIVAGFVALRDALGRRFRRAVLFAAIVPVALGLQILHTHLATDGAAGGVQGAGALVRAFIARSTTGVDGYFGGFTPRQVAIRVLHHLRFLFGVPGIAIALLAVPLAPWLGRAAGRPECRFGPRARSTMAGLAALALLYSVPLLQAVVVHRYWLIVALPLVAFLVGAAVHATTTGPAARVLWIATALVVGVATTRTVFEAQRADRTPFYEELGVALREHVPLGVPLVTTERQTSAVDFYAERKITYGFGDRDLDHFLAEGARPAFPSAGVCAVVEPAVDPASLRADRLVAFLHENWEATRIRLEKSGADLFQFDSSKRKAKVR